MKRAIESGILNNTNRTHEFVDLIAKISANKGVSFNFADNAKLKESGFALDGKQVNGFVTADGVTININSAKALNSVVGHEITHVLEGTELYNELQSAITEYAKSKGDYQGRYDTLTELYKDIEGADIDAELTADLVGDYLFTDADFVQRLSTEHRGVFQKLFDEIKHLCKLATAGTKEARELEKVKKLFEDAYRTETKNPTADGGVRYSVSEQTAQPDLTAEYHKTVDQVKNGTYQKSEPAIIGYTPLIYQELGMPSLPFVIGPGHIYSIAKSEAEAKADKRYSKNVNYHGLGDQTVKDILERVSDPVMIIFSKDVNANAVPMRSTHSIVAIADIGIDGKSVFAPIEITAERTINGGQYDVNVLSSVYGKSAQNLVAEAIARENIGEVGVFYLNSKASALLADGVQFPKRLTDALASNGIVHSFSEKVNMNISDATQSQQFKRWFGDWQNNPENASKVVNDDGTPKIVYHGSDSLHSVFSYGNIGSASGTPILGEGFYFTDDAELAKGYGENVYECYLQIKKPYYATEADVYKLNANTLAAQGYDGVILKAPAGNVYMTIDNTQIKSATDNIGTFDGNNPDIRYSLSEQGTVPAGGYRITGEDIALAPTKEDIAQMEQEKNAAATSKIDGVEELGAPTREDILQMEMERELYGDWRMTDPLDRKVEKLYRMMLREQISEEEYNAQLVKADRQYQQRGSRVEDALERIRQAYSTHQAVTADESAVKQKEVEAVLGEKGAYVSKQANALYDEVKSMQKGKRVSNTLSYLLDTLDLSEEHKAESYNSLRTALLNIRDNPNQEGERKSAEP